mgnify:CR=1 FL=1
MAKRINTTVEDDLYERVSAAAIEAGVTRTDLLNALVHLWDQDDTIKSRAIEPAKRNREETVRRQYSRSK